uniref:VP4 n=1 Tax=Fomede virus TaxID=2547356 RepID=A0A482A564_9REOV|nr:VP4 [Fomede virus]
MEFSLVFRKKDDSHSLYERCHSGDIVITTKGCGRFDATRRWIKQREACPRWHGTSTYDPSQLTVSTQSGETKHVKIHPCALDVMIGRLDDTMREPLEDAKRIISDDPLQVEIPLDTDIDGAETWVRFACFKTGFKHFRCYAPLLYANCTGGVHPPSAIYNAISLRYMGMLNYDAAQPTVIARQSLNGALIYGAGQTGLLDTFNFSDQITSAKTVKQKLVQFSTDTQWKAFNSTNLCPVIASFHRIMRSYTAAVAATMLSSLSLAQLRKLRPKAQLGRSPMDYLKYVTKLDVKPPGIADKTFTWQIISGARLVFGYKPLGAEEEAILDRYRRGKALEIEDLITLYPPAVALKEIHDTRRPYTTSDVRILFQLQTLLSAIPGLNFYPAYVVGTNNMSDTISATTWAIANKSRSFPSQWSSAICNANNLEALTRSLDTRESPFKTLVPLTVATDFTRTYGERNMMTTVVGSMCQGICEVATFVIPVKLPRKGVILLCIAPSMLTFQSCEIALQERFPRVYHHAFARALIRMDASTTPFITLDYQLFGPIRCRVVNDDIGVGTYLILQSAECVLEQGEFFLKLSERSARP